MATERLPKEVRAAQILEVARKNPKVTTKEISFEIDLAYSVVQRISKELKEAGQWPVDENEIDPITIPAEQRCFAFSERSCECIALRERSPYCNTPGCAFYKTKEEHEKGRLKAAKRCENRGLAYGEDYTQR